MLILETASKLTTVIRALLSNNKCCLWFFKHAEQILMLDKKRIRKIVISKYRNSSVAESNDRVQKSDNMAAAKGISRLHWRLARKRAFSHALHCDRQIQQVVKVTN